MTTVLRQHPTETRWAGQARTKLFGIALKTLPGNPPVQAALQEWDQQLAPDFLGFWLDDSGVFVFPNYNFVPQAAGLPDHIQQTLTQLFAARSSAGTNVPNHDAAANDETASRQMLAAMVMGAEGVQMGSRFVASEEASSHLSFKNAVIHAQEGDTVLTMKQLTPVRLIKNRFFQMQNVPWLITGTST